MSLITAAFGVYIQVIRGISAAVRQQYTAIGQTCDSRRENLEYVTINLTAIWRSYFLWVLPSARNIRKHVSLSENVVSN